MLSKSGSPHCVVLIHGTWGGRSAWSLSESAWATTAANFADVARFTWSGSNRQSTRIQASFELAECLANELGSYKTIHLVAHSHGGNIATRAAGITPERIMSIVTLGTPYIHADIYSSNRIADSTITALLTLTALLTIAGIFLGTSYLPNLMVPFQTESNSHLFGTAVTGILFLLTVGIYALLEPMVLRLRTRIEQRYAGFGTNQVPVLAIYYENDEAFRLLRHSSGLQRAIDKVPRFLYRPFQMVISDDGKDRILTLGTLLIALPGAAFAAAMSDIGWLSIVGTLGLATMPAVFLLKAANWFTPVLSGAATLGVDCWVDMMLAQVRVRRTPIGPGPVTARHLRFAARFVETKGGLVHSSICHDQRALEEATEWIVRKISNLPLLG